MCVHSKVEKSAPFVENRTDKGQHVFLLQYRRVLRMPMDWFLSADLQSTSSAKGKATREFMLHSKQHNGHDLK